MMAVQTAMREVESRYAGPAQGLVQTAMREVENRYAGPAQGSVQPWGPGGSGTH